MTTSSLVTPIVLWGRNAPTHCISSILITPDSQHLVTGCNDGYIIVWDISPSWQVRL